MISKSHKKKMVKLIGTKYVVEIQAYLLEQGLFNQKGNPHSASMITNVMNGKHHKVLEAAIYDLAAIKKEEQKKEILERDKVLKSA